VAAVERRAARNLPKIRQLSTPGTVSERGFHSVETSCLLLLFAEAGVDSTAVVCSGSFPARRRERRGDDDIGLSNTIPIFLDR